MLTGSVGSNMTGGSGGGVIYCYWLKAFFGCVQYKKIYINKMDSLKG